MGWAHAHRGGDTANRSDHIDVTVAGDACTGLGQQAGPARATGLDDPSARRPLQRRLRHTLLRGHTGKDFRAATGTPVLSSNTGTVVRSGALKSRNGDYYSYGNLVVIAVAGQPRTNVYYAHLSRREVRTGDTVGPPSPKRVSGIT